MASRFAGLVSAVAQAARLEKTRLRCVHVRSDTNLLAHCQAAPGRNGSLSLRRRLDHVLGADHKGRYNFAELRAIVSLHAGLKMGSDEDDQAMLPSLYALRACRWSSSRSMSMTLGSFTLCSPTPSTRRVWCQPYYVRFDRSCEVVFTETLEIPAKSTKLKASFSPPLARDACMCHRSASNTMPRLVNPGV